MSVFPTSAAANAGLSPTRSFTAVSQTGASLPRLLLALLAAPLVLGFLSFAVTATLGASTLGDPILTSAAFLRRLVFPDDRSDSWGPMIQALTILHGTHGGTLYDTLFFQQHEKFQYAPTSLVWLEGISHLVTLTPASLNRINAVAFVINSVACAFLFRVCTSGGTSRIADKNRDIATGLALLLPFVFWPTVYGFTVGQIQVWIDLLVTLAVLFWCLGHKTACGIALGLTCTIKPQLGLFLLWGLAWREWGFAAAMAATAALFGATSVLMYGLASHLGFIDVLQYIARHGESFRANQSVNGLLNRILFVGNNNDWDPASFAPFNPIVYWGTLSSGLVLMALPLVTSRTRGSRRASVFDLCFAVICFTMASPIAWEHHYGVALPAYVVAMGAWTRGGNTRRWLSAALVVSWILVGSNLQIVDLLSGTYLNPLQSHVLFGAILLLLCLAGLRRSAAIPGAVRLAS